MHRIGCIASDAKAHPGPCRSREERPVLGIDFGGTKVALCLDDAGLVLASDRIAIRSGDTALEVVDRSIAAALRMLDACGAPVTAVGIVTPGIVHDHRIELAPNVDGWSELSLRDRFVDGLGIPLVVVGNDVKAAALAEATTGALAGVDPGFYLNRNQSTVPAGDPWSENDIRSWSRSADSASTMPLCRHQQGGMTRTSMAKRSTSCSTHCRRSPKACGRSVSVIDGQ